MPRPGIVIPFTHNNQVVGHTTRFLDDRTPKYIQDIQPGYVFGTDLQRDSWQWAIVVEGVFDALAINGLAVLHAEVNDAQVRLIRSLGRDIIVVPDQDEAGMKLVDRAVELGWSVSIPTWPDGCKDVNDAVIRLGRVGCLLTILENRETSRIKIEMRKKQLVKRLRD
jgi:DNA primase